jgi:hypothetical protein
VDSLKALDPNRPIREADISTALNPPGDSSALAVALVAVVAVAAAA